MGNPEEAASFRGDAENRLKRQAAGGYYAGRDRVGGAQSSGVLAGASRSGW
jgi:hypothetical protein